MTDRLFYALACLCGLCGAALFALDHPPRWAVGLFLAVTGVVFMATAHVLHAIRKRP
jgi:hypothetical protein